MDLRSLVPSTDRKSNKNNHLDVNSIKTTTYVRNIFFKKIKKYFPKTSIFPSTTGYICKLFCHNNLQGQKTTHVLKNTPRKSFKNKHLFFRLS